MSSSRQHLILKCTAKQFNQVVFSLCTEVVMLISHYCYHGRIKLKGNRCAYINLFMMLTPGVDKLI